MSRLAMLTLAALSIAGCAPSEAPGVDPNRTPRNITSNDGDLGSVVQGNSAFAFDVYGALADTEDGNLFVSPMSMSAALGMTMAGADGTTLTEMSQVLGVSVPEAAWHAAFGDLIVDLNGDFDRGYTLYLANRLWGQEGYPFEQAFLDVCATDYDAPMEPWDFRGDPTGGRARVNEWVEGQTNDRITDLLPENSVTSDTRLILANAIYFLADWAHAFDPAQTRDAAFTLLDGGTATTPIMAMDTGDIAGHGMSFGYIDGGKVARLPYQDDEVSMYLVVPDATDGLPDLEEGLDADTFDRWVDALGRPGDAFLLRMPTFEMAFEVDLAPVLAGLGLTTPFESSTANFDRMATTQEDGRLFVSGVFHKAFVKVDESGTEAAAATGVVVGVDSAPPTVDATHPFLFVLRDDLTGTVLFIGRVMDPTAG